MGNRPKRSRRAPEAHPHVLVLLGYGEHDFLRGILAHAREAGWTLDTNYNRIGLAPPPGERFSGILAVVGKRRELDVLRRHPRVPCVDLSGAWLWDLRAAGARRVGRVTYDPGALGRMAANYLLDVGLRQLAFLNTCNGWHERPVARAVASEAARRGADFREIALFRKAAAHAPYSATRHSSAVMRWLARSLRELPKPCGVVVVDDWAPHLLRVCAQEGLAVPSDVAVMGLYNHRDACEYAPVPISSVDANCERIAREGARLLGRMMDGEPPPAEPVLIPPERVVVRQSTNTLAVRHGAVARAVRFIQRHFRGPLSVSDVAAASGLSLRGLTTAFRRELGESVARHIARCRSDEAGRLLCETGLKAAEVAERAGFSGLEHLCRAFKRAKGIPPGLYRRRHPRPER